MICEHPTEVEYELIRHGQRLRTIPNAGFTWRDLWVVVTCAPPGSPIAAVLNPDAAVTNEAAFLRSIEHSARWLVWSKTEGAAKRTEPPPAPIRFSWENSEDAGYQTDSMTPAQVNDALGWAALVDAENERRAAAGRPLIPTA